MQAKVKSVAAEDYLDFELNVEALDAGKDGNKLRVTVNNSPVGSVSVETPNPFTPDEIGKIILLLEGSTQVARSELAQVVRAFGEKLFGTIFSGQVYAAYLASLEKGNLRIRLGLEDSGSLADIPWEVLRDPKADYLALSRQTPIVRYPRVLTVRPLVEVRLPLRVLVMISSPDDQEVLDVDAEWRALEESTAELRNGGLLELDRVEDGQLVTLQRMLREGGEYQVFHFIGHSAFDERSKTGMLAFEDAKGKNSAPVSGEALARELSEEHSIRLVVLNACQGARANRADPFGGIATSIVARGVPAVVAMQFSISDGASRLFSQEFYQAISEGYPIEAALVEARRVISSSLNNFEWATPVLYLRAPTGMLFPRRRIEGNISTGGLREALSSRRLIPFVGGLLLLLIIGCFLLSNAFKVGPSGPSTPVPPTATIDIGVRDVDLTVTRLGFSPRNPKPGELVRVTMDIMNVGTTPSGPFRWAWFAHDPLDDPQPSITQDEKSSLDPGIPLTVKGDFLFGLPGTYQTTAWVNFDGQVTETNLLNNLIRRPVTITGNDPMVVDFTQLPNGDELSNPAKTPIPLKGDEFKDWGFHILPDTSADPTCKDAKLQVDLGDNLNRLITRLQGQAGVCTNLPIIFTFDPPIGGAAVKFQAKEAGKYSLELRDANDKKVGSGTVDSNGGQETVTVRIPATGPGLQNVQKIVVSGPGAAGVVGVAFSLPGQLVPVNLP